MGSIFGRSEEDEWTSEGSVASSAERVGWLSVCKLLCERCDV